MSKSKNSKIIGIFLLIAVVIVVSIFLVTKTSRDNRKSITNFDECAAAGYPIQESYPERCAIPGGPTFTRQLPKGN